MSLQNANGRQWMERFLFTLAQQRNYSDRTVTAYSHDVERFIEFFGEDPADGVKPKGVIHWVSADKYIDCNIHLYERLFHEPIPDGNGRDFLEAVEPESLKILTNCKAELSLAQAEVGKPYQFEREGYFCKDDQDSDLKKITFNQTIALRSNWLEH